MHAPVKFTLRVETLYLLCEKMDEDPGTKPMSTPRQRKETLVNAFPKDFRLAYDLCGCDYVESFAEIGQSWKIISNASENQIQAQAIANRPATARRIAVPQPTVIALAVEGRRRTAPKITRTRNLSIPKRRTRNIRRHPPKPQKQR